MNKRPDADKAPTAADHEALEQWLRTQFGPEPVGRRAVRPPTRSKSRKKPTSSRRAPRSRRSWTGRGSPTACAGSPGCISATKAAGASCRVPRNPHDTARACASLRAAATYATWLSLVLRCWRLERGGGRDQRGDLPTQVGAVVVVPPHRPHVPVAAEPPHRT